MADTSLPDEIISEILSPALKVADDAFANNYSKSPFARFTESTSAYLVVCKSWLRVATPLLYHVVVLRSKAQAKALANALAKNPDLGRFVKKLRVEGGYGPSMHTILQHSPNITDLYLSLDILATDTTEGLCKGLPLINPTRLIFQCENGRDRSNKAYTALVDVLKKCIQQWDELIFFRAPEGVWKASVTNLCTLFNQQKRLEVIVTESHWVAKDIFPWFSGCPLREVRVVRPVSAVELEYLNTVVDARLKEIIVYSTVDEERRKHQESQTHITPSLNPFFTPLANESTETQDAIFSRILYFAMLVPERAVPSAPSKSTPDVSILRVCKRFHRVGLPHLYAHVLLSKATGSNGLASALETNPSLAKCIRTISLHYPLGWFPEADEEDDERPRVREVLEAPFEYPGMVPKPTTSFVRIFSATTNLRDVSLVLDSSVHVWAMRDIPVSRDAFMELAKAAGPTLRTLGIFVQGAAMSFSEPALNAAIFGNFTALETLTWKSSIPISGKSDLAITIPKLSRLEVLEASDSFFSAFARIALPSLSTLELRHNITAYVQPFFEEHGSKLALLDIPLQMLDSETLDESVLDLCPSLVELKLACFGSKDNILYPGRFDEVQGIDTSATLKKLSLSAKWSEPYGADRKMPAEWAEHIVEVPFAEIMPNLTEISLPGLEWPSVEREIAKHPWVRAAERLHSSNICVSDRYQVKWRPRLKVGRGRK
uniref:F-box domain-containing protein n=1 Tax=Mycena chlorophos TaxID=658473 RepID=A0ABQ0LQV7_MYCCL|nr:predicted protein [Mycena chlorophos]